MHSVYPRRNHSIPIITTRPGSIRFGEYLGECAFGYANESGLDDRTQNDRQLTELIKNWLNCMNGDREVSDVIDALVSSLPCGDHQHLKTQLRQIISIGLQAGALIDSNAIPASSRWTTPKNLDRVASDLTHQRILHPYITAQELARTLDHRCESPVHIVGSNYLSQAIARSAQAVGLTTTADPLAASIIVFPSISHPEVSDYNFVELERQPHLHVGIRHVRAVVGPLVIPGVTSCFRCMHLHRVDQDSTWPMQTISWRNSIEYSTADSSLILITANFTLCVIRSWLDGQLVTDTTWRTELPIPLFTTTYQTEHPLCGCNISS